MREAGVFVCLRLFQILNSHCEVFDLVYRQELKESRIEESLSRIVLIIGEFPDNREESKKSLVASQLQEHW